MSYELRAKRLLHGLAAGLFSLVLTTGAYGGGWEGTSSLSLTETYDDNPSRGSDSSAREQQGDGITAVRSGLTLHRATEQSQLDLNHQIFHELFYRDSGMNNTDQTGSFGYLYQFSSRLRGGIKDDLRITEDVDTNLDPQGLRFSSSRGRSRKRFNALGLFLEPQLTPRLGARMDYTHSLTDVSVADESDETRQTLGATLNYLADIPRADLAYLAYNLSFSSSDRNGQDLPPQNGQGTQKGNGNLKARKQISRKVQENPKGLPRARSGVQGQGIQADNRGEDFRSHSLQLGYTRHLNPTLTLGLRGGLNWIASDDPEDDGETGWIGGMNLEKAWARTKLSLNLYRDVSAGGRRGRPTTSQGLAGTLSRELSPKLQASLSATFSDNQSLGGTRGENRGGGEDGTYGSLGLNLNYRPSDWWSATLSYHHSIRRRDGDGQGNNLQEGDRKNDTYAGLNVGLHFDLSSRWKMDLGYAFSRRSDQRNFGGSSPNSQQIFSNREEDPERNRFWLTFTHASPLKF